MFGRHSEFWQGPWTHEGCHAFREAARGSGRHHGGPHRGGGFPFGGRGGFGAPFGGFPFGGQRARRGDVRAAILALLAEQPRNGYQIMQELEKRSRGLWRPSPGSVYPALQQLQDEGLIREEAEGGGRTYHLTEAGREYVKANPDEARADWDAGGEDDEDSHRELFSTMRDLGIALWQISRTGTAGQRSQARKLLDETRRALYRILANEGGRRDG